MQFKNIIPELVSFETNLNKIKGSCLLSNLNFFEKVNKSNHFHYKVFVDNNIEIPKDFDFRNEYYIKKDKTWFYERKIFFIHFKFKYDIEKKIFCFNKLYYLLPFTIGGIFPIGRHVVNIITIDLLLENFMIFRGFALDINNNILAFISPGFNGKTSFLSESIKNFAKYITDDHLIINTETLEVYPTTSSRAEWFLNRPINGKLEKLISTNKIEKKHIDKIFLVQNSMSQSYNTSSKSIIDFWILNSTYFWDSLLIRSYVFENNLWKKILEKLTNINKISNLCEFKQIRNYNYSNLINNFMNTSKNENHWNIVGGEYDNTWKRNYARKIYSDKEMNFVLKYFNQQKPNNLLDIGIGSGRILENYIENSKKIGLKSNFYGVDIAQSMVDYCKNKFKNEDNVILAKCDISNENIPFNSKFNFISSIRVLKYNENWAEIVAKVYDQLEPGGVFVFTILNRNSMDRFVSYPVKVYLTSYTELLDILNKTGFEIIEISGLSKIKDFFYRKMSDNILFAKLLIFTEKILEFILGKKLFCREFFIACKK